MANMHDAVAGVLAGGQMAAAWPGPEIEEDAEALLRDELAEALRGAGCAGAPAQRYAAVMLAVLAKKDARAVGGLGEADSLSEADAQEGLRLMAFRLLDAPKPRFSVGCLVLASGFDHPAVKSARQWAKAQGFSHEHAANEAEEWQRIMGLRRTAGQKSEAARSVYQRTNGARRRVKGANL